MAPDQSRIQCLFLQKLQLCPRLSSSKFLGSQQLSVSKQRLRESRWSTSPGPSHTTLSKALWYMQMFCLVLVLVFFLSTLNEVCPFVPICLGLRCCALVRQLLVLNVVYTTFKINKMKILKTRHILCLQIHWIEMSHYLIKNTIWVSLC